MPGMRSLPMPPRGPVLRDRQRGFTLVEVMIGIGIVSMMMLFAVPSMSSWIQNSRIRNSSEAILGGLQLARSEAVRRNTQVELVLTSVAAGGVSTDWVVRCVTPSADCPGIGMTPTEIQQGVAKEGSPTSKVTVSPTMSAIVFNGTGRLTPTPAGNVTLNIGLVSEAGCLADGGEYRCLRLVVSPAGQVRMCDPALTSPNPRAC